MGITFVLAVVLIAIGLRNEELYGREAALWGGATLLCLALYLLLPVYQLMAVVPQVIIDIVLLFKVFGGDVGIR